jgi:hypothetical protein
MSELGSLIDSLAIVDAHQLPEPVLLVEIEELLTARDRLDAVINSRLQVADARQVMVNLCGRQVRSWLVEEAHLSPQEAGRRMGVANALPFHPELAAALGAGEISQDHTRVILGCLRRLAPDWREVAEGELIDAARDVDSASLGRLCRELRIRSGADEDAEAAAQRMYDSRWATVRTSFDGMVHLEAMLGPEAGAIMLAALVSLMTPAGDGDGRLPEQRRADALVDLARFSLCHGELADHGGERPQVIVTIPLTELQNGLEPGQVGHASINGLAITPSAARRIACDANIVPAVLGGPSEVLDLGRSRRLFSRAQRRAAAIRDGGCVWPKCQAPLSRSELHHENYWEHGGHTNHDQSAWVCTFHHWLVHHTPWTMDRNTQGHIEVQRT